MFDFKSISIKSGSLSGIRWKSVLLFCFFLFASFFIVPNIARANPKYASFVIDADTGAILHERYADKRLHPASLTKVMTLLLTFEAIESGRLSLKSRIRMSNHAAGMVPSKLYIPAGASIKVEDAIYALVTKSANDVAVALAEHLGGTEGNFARLMTRKARNIGMRQTTFKNASGLHDKQQITTARDMAKMAAYVIERYPRQYRYFSTTNFSYKGKSYHNHNRLLGKYRGMDGMKTGYINASGFNLVASAKRDGRRIIGVVFGGRTAVTRNNHMARLLDEGFNKIKNLHVARVEAPLPKRKPVILNAIASLERGKMAAPKNVLTHPNDSQDYQAQKWASLNAALESGQFGALVGEGDVDPALANRVRTGLLAIAAHEGDREKIKALNSKIKQAADNQAKDKNVNVSNLNTNSWSIQLGAFKSRAATDRVISKAQSSLPPNLSKASPTIAPLKTSDGWLFRARLTGLNEAEANQACKFLKQCMPVAPYN